MSILSQQKSFLKSTSYQGTQTYITRIPTQVQCAATTTTKPKPNSPRLVIEPSPTSPPPAQTTASKASRCDDPDLKSTWTHRAWFASGCIMVLISLAKSVTESIGSHIWAKPILAGLAGYILADLVSGVYHWGIDNYGDGTTPIFGPQIEAFQGHHKCPWTITKRQLANNLHSLAGAITFTVLPLNLILHDPTQMAFIASFSAFIMFSQQFHAWSHLTKSKLPKIVVALQDLGVLVSRSQHAAHHRPPYNSNYCIVSGIWNKFLDDNKVFEKLEMVLFYRLGLRPRSWSELSSEWTEDNSTLSSSKVAQ